MSRDDRQVAEAEGQWLSGGGEMGRLIRDYDWAKTPLGPIEQWSPTLRMMVSFIIANRFPLLLWWGPQYVSIYNDAYLPVLGTKHPKALAQPAPECWSEIWHILQPLIDTPFQGGPATWMDDIFLEINRHGFVEETHFTIAYSPVPDETVQRGIGGVLATVHEITEKVVGERRLHILRDLGSRSAEAKTAEEACALASKVLARYSKDIPFALLYLIDGDRKQARLTGMTGVVTEDAIIPLVVDIPAERDQAHQLWPIYDAVRQGTMQIVENLSSILPSVPGGPWTDPPRSAVAVPMRSNMPHHPAGVIVLGISSRLRFDDLYRSFFELVADQIADAITSASAYAEERKRAEALAELDRAKTAFFSNVSHEFRTPLTLMLGPLEELKTQFGRSNSSVTLPEYQQLDLVQRNALRLLKLVNTLLDFSRIEAGRAHAVYAKTDLSALTAELASVFRSTIENAGLRLIIDCPLLHDEVYVDREMWEKIVLNLLSNAFKFTIKGEIEVSLKESDEATHHVVLEVRDTGTGIAQDQLGKIFERFHRVPGAEGRTHEGTGIGLALVQELVRLQGGSISVDSTYGKGSTFRVSIPFGKSHLPHKDVEVNRSHLSTALGAAPFLEDALRWLPEAGVLSESQPPNLTLRTQDSGLRTQDATRPRVLVADDNADMRDYMHRLLAPSYDVIAVADGRAALESIRAEPPDLVLSDVMMPRLDGLGLLHELRADPVIKTIPIILLSARAGEEARIEGLQEGADDYLIKPFSARELLARVAAHLDMARVRRESQAEISRSKFFLERIADTTPDLLWVYDILEGKNIYINRSWTPCSDTGYKNFSPSPGTLTDNLVHSEDLTEMRKWYAGFDTSKEGDVREIEARLRHADGSYRWMLSRATVFERAPDGRCKQIIGVTSDITERKRQEAELVLGSRQRSLLYELANTVNRVEGISELYGKALAAIVNSLNADRASILLFDEDGVMRFKAWRGLSDEYRRAVEGHSPWHKNTLDPKPIVIGNIAEAGIEQHLQSVIRQEGIRALCFVPMSYGGRLIGKFMVYFDRPYSMSDEEIALAQAIAGTLAVGIERKTAEVRLRESEERFRAIAENIPQLVWMADGEGYVGWFNRRWLEFTGTTLEENQGVGWKAVHHPDYVDRVAENFERHLREGKDWEDTFPLRGQDGRFRWFLSRMKVIRDESGKVVRFFGTNTDVTEQRETEAALRESEERYRATFANAAVGIAHVGLDGRWLWVNDAVCRITSYAREELLMKPFDDITHPDDIESEWANARRLLAGENANYSMEKRYIRKEGGLTWIHLTVSLQRDETSSPQNFICIIEDITARKQAETALRESEERLRSFAWQLERSVEERTQELVQSQDRLRELATELNLAEQRERKRLAGELHDYLAQLLVVCRLNLGQVRRAGLPPKGDEMVRETEEVLNQALQYSRTLMAELSPSVLQEHGLSAGLKWLGEQMQRHGLTVTVEVGDALDLSLSEDCALLLFQSVRELLMNALKHAGSNVVAVRLEQGESRLRIEVRDEGVGFDFAAAAAASSPITALSSKYGLFSIRERMTALGGWFDVQSTPGQGTTATLVLPLSGGAADASETRGRSETGESHERLTRDSRLAPVAPVSRHAKIRVLLVDDHAMVRQGLRSVLDSYVDLEVVGEAWNGAEAVAVAEALQPAVVLMDINMPEMNGIEATEAIKARFPDIIVIGLSVNAGGENERAMKNAGAAMLLTKEAAVDELYLAIQDALGGGSGAGSSEVKVLSSRFSKETG